LRLLAGIWPEEVNGRLEALERLGRLLGDDHDLAVFAETLRTEPRCFDSERDREVLLGLIEQRRRPCARWARPLGERLYAEQPTAFCRRLQRYWRAGEPGRTPGRPSSPTPNRPCQQPRGEQRSLAEDGSIEGNSGLPGDVAQRFDDR